MISLRIGGIAVDSNNSVAGADGYYGSERQGDARCRAGCKVSQSGRRVVAGPAVGCTGRRLKC